MRSAKKVVISEEVAEYVSELSYRLFINEYFGYFENALSYVDDIYDQIFENIHNSKHYKVPIELQKFGDNYFLIKSGKRTAWHIYFIEKNEVYYITKILNNYLPEAEFLNQ